MIDEMVVKNAAKKIFDEMGVTWLPVRVEDDKPSDRWVLLVEIESQKKSVEFCINKCTFPKLEEAIRRHVRFQLEKLGSN